MQILCATDFSATATTAADIAAGLAKKLRLPLRLLYCSHPPMVMGELPVVEPGDEAERERLKNEADRLRAIGIEVSEEFRRGNAGSEIIAAAAEQPTKLVVLASTGSGKALRWLIGSVAERVAENASSPTLIVRKPDLLQAWLEDAAPLHFLCGVDFTMSADVAVTEARSLIALGNVEVDAVHVRPDEYPAPSTEQQLSRQRDVWERMRPILGDVPVKVHVANAADQPAVEFLNVAEKESAGLIVLGAHQRHGLHRLQAPSFSRAVIVHARTNLLCVPLTSTPRVRSIPGFRRVLLASNFTGVCAEALRYAHSLLPCGGNIHFVHVCPDPGSGINPLIASEVYFEHSLATGAAKKQAEDKINALPLELMQAPGIDVSVEVLVHHNVATAICDAAKRFGADVICMGTKAHSRLGTALLGSTVQAVLSRAEKPVLVVPPSVV